MGDGPREKKKVRWRRSVGDSPLEKVRKRRATGVRGRGSIGEGLREKVCRRRSTQECRVVLKL